MPRRTSKTPSEANRRRARAARSRSLADDRLPKVARPAIAKILRPKPKSKAKARMKFVKARSTCRPVAPRPHKLTELAKMFLSQSEVLSNPAKATASGGARPYDTPLATFKRLAYKLIRNIVSTTGGYQILKNIHNHYLIDHKGPTISDNPFYAGLVAINMSQKNKLSPHRLAVISREMLYAHRNDVPPGLLVGFLHQIGDRSVLVEKLADDDREPWDLDDRILRFKDPDLAES